MMSPHTRPGSGPERIELMFEMSSPARERIIRLVSVGARRHGEIVQATGIEPPEVTRHIQRLLRCGLIRRRSNMYTATQTARCLLHVMDEIEFIRREPDVVRDYDLSSIHCWGRYNLMPLVRAERLKGVLNVISRSLMSRRKAVRFIRAISNEPIPTILEASLAAARRGVDVRIIYGTERGVPPIDEPSLQVRVLPEEVPCLMSVDESSGAVALPRWDGTFSLSTAFASESQEMLSLLVSMFNILWERARPLSEDG